MPSPLPNIPMIPVENAIAQMAVVDIVNLAVSFFVIPTGRGADELRNLMLTVRRIFDGRCISVLREEALNLYQALELTSISDITQATQSDLIIAIADYYVYRSENP